VQATSPAFPVVLALAVGIAAQSLARLPALRRARVRDGPDRGDAAVTVLCRFDGSAQSLRLAPERRRRLLLASHPSPRILPDRVALVEGGVAILG
jgi:hypothetical protein